MKAKFKNIMIAATMASVFYLIMKYQDTESFQVTMRFLFNPDASLALPPYWQENRMIIEGGIIVILLMYYKSIWYSYKNLIQIYRDSPERKNKPPLSSLNASYLQQQDKSTCVSTWIIDLCCNDVFCLHYKKGAFPWSVSRGESRKMRFSDQQLVDILFQNDDRVNLKASFSEPNPSVKDVADKLYKDIKSENSHFFETRKSSVPAWLLFFALIAEVPFYIASQASTIPATLIITMFSAGLTALPVYVICHEFPAFFGGSRIKTFIMAAVTAMFAMFGHWIMFNSAAAASYWVTAFFPGLVITLIVIVYNLPLLPHNSSLLSHIIGYRKYLERDDSLITEKDLPWTLGLGVQTDIIANSFHYEGQSMPKWIKSSENDVQSLLKTLHQTLIQHVSKAINGEMDSSHSGLSGGRDKGRF